MAPFGAEPVTAYHPNGAPPCRPHPDRLRFREGGNGVTGPSPQDTRIERVCPRQGSFDRRAPRPQAPCHRIEFALRQRRPPSARTPRPPRTPRFASTPAARHIRNVCLCKRRHNDENPVIGSRSSQEQESVSSIQRENRHQRHILTMYRRRIRTIDALYRIKSWATN